MFTWFHSTSQSSADGRPQLGHSLATALGDTQGHAPAPTRAGPRLGYKGPSPPFIN